METNKYERQKYAVIAVDVAVFCVSNRSLHVLLVQTNKPELKGLWALPGGLIKADEDLESAVQRVLKEKTGLTGVLYDQLRAFGAPDRDPFGRVVSVAYLALVDAEKVKIQTSDKYDAIKWSPLSRVSKLAYDHNLIVREAADQLRAKIQHSNIAKGILPAEFTLTELQSIYEIILGQKLDKRNFRRKVIVGRLVRGTGRRVGGRSNRPAGLYTFSDRKLVIRPIWS